MVETPTIWKDKHQINPPENIDPFQDQAVVADIGGGRYIAVYSDGTGDLKGQVFDVEGNRVGDEINLTQTGSIREDGPAAVASRPGGGFVLAYETNLPLDPDATTIRAKVFDTELDLVGDITLVDPATEIPGSTDIVSNPSVAMQDDGSYVVAYLRKDSSDGSFDVMAKRVKADQSITNEITIYDSDNTEKTSTEVAALSDGNYVIVYEKYFPIVPESDPAIQIVDPDLTPVFAGSADLSSDDATDVQVAALKDGRFAVAWVTENDGDAEGIEAIVYFNNGAPASSVIQVNTTTGGIQWTPDIAPLADGGFVVTWDDGARGDMYAQRFDKDGNKVGDEFLAGKSGGTTEQDPAVAALADGRFIVVFDESVPFDVFGTIFDPRDDVINGTDEDDVLTSRIDGAKVKGGNGNDVLLGQKNKDTLDGGKGNDALVGRKGNDTLKGGKGNDFLVGEKGKDTLTGGKDEDTFLFDSKLDKKKNVDTITDFEVNKDTILLDFSTFKAVGQSLSKKEFVIGKKAKDKNDHIIYNKKNGDLSYDKNGSKKGGSTLFAELDNNLKLDHKDFDVIA